MKKLILIILLFVLILQPCITQENVYIMIDVSRSGIKRVKESSGKSLISDIVTGSYNYTNHAEWNVVNPDIPVDDSKLKNIISGSKQSLIGNGTSCGIIEFGKYGRHKNSHNFSMVNTNSDFTDFYNNKYPDNVWKDNYTYINIVEAWIAVQAKAVPVNAYYLFRLSDELQDQGSTSSQVTYTQEETEWIAAYGTANASKVRLLTMQYEKNNKQMFLVISKIYNLQSSQNPIPKIQPDKSAITPKITIQTYANGVKGDEAIAKSNQLKLSWTCKGCQKGIKYRVKITGFNNTDFNDTKTVSANFLNLTLENGSYRINISGFSSNQNIKVIPDKTYIKVKTGGGVGFLIILLIIAALGTLLYYSWKKNRKPKKKVKPGKNKDQKNGYKII